jgi:pimeloyl-ACP methyl ester carboxylesterase
LLHGLGAAGSAWGPVASNLAIDHRLVIPDLLGSGRTAKPLITYKPDEMAVHIGGLLEGLGISSLAAVAGHSQGAAVAVELCHLWPGRVDKLVLVDPPPPAGVPWLRPVTRLPLGARSAEIFSALLPHRQLARLWLGFLYADRSRVTDQILDDYRATSASRGYAAATARALHSLARLELHLEQAPPSLLLWGAEDRVFPPSLADDWQRRLRDSKCSILPATGHCPHEEQPEAVAFAIRQFLAGERERRSA